MVNMILGTSWRDGDKLTNPEGWGPGKEGRPGIQIARHKYGPPKSHISGKDSINHDFDLSKLNFLAL